MPCHRYKDSNGTTAILCVGNEPIEIKHNGLTYRFEWTASSGWIAVNKDGYDRKSLVPKAVCDKLDKVERPKN